MYKTNCSEEENHMARIPVSEDSAPVSRCRDSRFGLAQNIKIFKILSNQKLPDNELVLPAPS